MKVIFLKNVENVGQQEKSKRLWMVARNFIAQKIAEQATSATLKRAIQS